MIILIILYVLYALFSFQAGKFSFAIGSRQKPHLYHVRHTILTLIPFGILIFMFILKGEETSIGNITVLSLAIPFFIGAVSYILGKKAYRRKRRATKSQRVLQYIS